MAGGAGSARLLAVLLVARQAAQAFVDADRVRSSPEPTCMVAIGAWHW